MGAHFSSLNEHSTEPAGRNPDNVLGAILLISTSGEVTELYTYSTYIPYFSEYWGVLGLASCFSSGRGVLYHATLEKVRYSDRQNFRVRCRSRAAWNPRIWMGRVQRTCAVPRACGLVPDKRRIVRTDDERSERAQTPTNRERLLCRAVIVRPADRPTTRRTANPLCTLMSSSCTQ